jgi:hypothetical protein
MRAPPQLQQSSGWKRSSGQQPMQKEERWRRAAVLRPCTHNSPSGMWHIHLHLHHAIDHIAFMQRDERLEC